MSSDDLMQALRDCGALLEGHFVLSSGKHSGHYVQVAQVGRDPALLERLLKTREAELQALNIETVLSAAIGGIVVGQQLALLLGKASVFAERKSDKMELRRGFNLRPGERVLLVEDVVTTGGTLAEIADLARAAGAEVAGAFTLINRSGSETWGDLPLHSVVAVDFPVYAADEVPPELAAVPQTRPGSKPLESS